MGNKFEKISNTYKNKSSKLSIVYHITSLILVVLMLGGCTREANYDIGDVSEPKQEYVEWEYDGGDYISATEKAEIVTAHADAAGKIKEIDDAVSLKGIKIDEGETIHARAVRELANLEDINNKDGDESFEQQERYIYFENLGKDISYEGKGVAELPVNIDIKYYLDGKLMEPGEIAGEKGHVKIDYALENSEMCELEIDGVPRNLHVPFTVISIVTMEDDTYSNLKLKDCEKTSFNSEDVIMAMTMPGMRDNLKALSFDATDIDIPESFSIEFDTESFEIGFSTSIITSGLLDDSTDLSDLDELKDSLSDLSSAGKELSDASGNIAAGLSKFEKYLDAYTKGVRSLDSGISNLADGIKSLDDNKADVSKGAGDIRDGIAAYDDAFTQMRPVIDAMIENDPDNEELKSLKEWYDAMAEQSARLRTGSAEYAAGVDEYAKGIASAAQGVSKIKSGSSELSSQGSQLLEGYDSITGGFSQYKKGINKFYKDGISRLESEGYDKINDVENLVRMIEDAGKEYKTYSGLEKNQEGSVTIIIETEEVGVE